jgi:hypothetical protein
MYLILTFTCMRLLLFLHWPEFTYCDTCFIVICSAVTYTKKERLSVRLNINGYHVQSSKLKLNVYKSERKRKTPDGDLMSCNMLYEMTNV